MEEVNVYTLGYKSNEVQTKIKDILEQIECKSSGKNGVNFNFNNYFNWFNETLKKTIQKIKEIVKESKKNDRFREIIIYSFENFEKHKNEIEILFESYDSERYFQPFFICIANNEIELTKIKDGIKKEIDIFFEDEDKEKEIYENNFSYLQLNFEETNNIINNSQKMEREIMKKFIRIYSYYNELGDDFFEVLKKQNEILQNHEEDKKRINLLCLGKSQRGKSSFINLLLKEKRAKEGGLGKKCSSKILKYKLDDIPLTIYDTIGISSDKNGEIVNELLLKIDELQKQLKNEMLHLILYFLDYTDPHIFDPKELNIFKQLCNGNIKAHYIFICTKFGEVNGNKKRSEKKINAQINSHIEKVRNSLKELCEGISVELIMTDNETNNKNKKDKKPITKKMSIIDYLYCCQENADINEVNTEIISEDIKLSKIINVEKSIAYINAIKCINNGNLTDKYGIESVCGKMINILEIIYEEIIKSYKKLLNENKEEKNLIEEENSIEEDNLIEEEGKPSKNGCYIDKKMKSNKNLLYEISIEEEEKPLINEYYIDEKKIDNILKKLEEKAHKKTKKYKIVSGVSGIIPIPGIDVLIQYFLKKDAIEDIASIFGDHLTEIKIDNKLNQKNEYDQNIEELINQTNNKIDDKKSDIGKTTFKAIQFLTNILHLLGNCGKITLQFLISTGTKILSGVLLVGGIVIGVGFGAYIMVSDIAVIINLFKERLKFRLLTINSFGKVIDYLNKLK